MKQLCICYTCFVVFCLFVCFTVPLTLFSFGFDFCVTAVSVISSSIAVFLRDCWLHRISLFLHSCFRFFPLFHNFTLMAFSITLLYYLLFSGLYLPFTCLFPFTSVTPQVNILMSIGFTCVSLC